MKRHESVKNTGHVGRRGAIVLPAATRRRYGLEDGTLYISEEREDGVLIRRAEAVPVELKEVQRKIQQGLDELAQGRGISGADVGAELKLMSQRMRDRKRM